MSPTAILRRQCTSNPGRETSNLCNGRCTCPINNVLVLRTLNIRCRFNSAVCRILCYEDVGDVNDSTTINVNPRRRGDGPTRRLCRSSDPRYFQDLSRRLRRINLFVFLFFNSTIVLYVFNEQRLFCFSQDMSSTRSGSNHSSMR